MPLLEDPDFVIFGFFFYMIGLAIVTWVFYRKLCGVLFVAYKFFILAFPVALARLYFSEGGFWVEYLRGMEPRYLSVVVLHVLTYMTTLVVGLIVLGRIKELSIKVPEMSMGLSVNQGVLVLIVISFCAKLYLMSTGAWFFDGIDGAGKTVGKFDFLATSVSNVDLLGLVAVAFYSNTHKKCHWSIFVIGVGLGMLFSLLSGSKQAVIMASLPLLVVALVRLKSVFGKVGFLCAAGLMLFLVFPHFQLYTHAVRQSAAFPPTWEEIQENTERIKKDYEQVTYGRMDYFVAYHKMLEVYEVRGFDPLGFGYTANIVGLVPRFLWANKPAYNTIGNEVARQLNFSVATDRKTSVGVTPIGEAFLLYGILGLIFGGIYASFLIVVIDRLADNNFLKGGMIVTSVLFMKQDWLSMAIPGLLLTILLSCFVGSSVCGRREQCKE